ncbi:MAG: hypothetical protein AAF202_11265 [Pseudomonadota bacterium]
MANSVSQQSFCAYCKTPRKVYLKRHITATNVWLSFLMSVLLMFTIWGTVDPRALFVFVVSLSVAEVFVQVRWRMGLRCQHCGFDPVIYMRDPSRAAKMVREHFERRSQSLEFLFTDSPKLREASLAHYKSQAFQGSTQTHHPEIASGGGLPEASDGSQFSSNSHHFELTSEDEIVDEGLTRT